MIPVEIKLLTDGSVAQCGLVTSTFQNPAPAHAEILALGQQLEILQRNARRRFSLTRSGQTIDWGSVIDGSGKKHFGLRPCELAVKSLPSFSAYKEVGIPETEVGVGMMCSLFPNGCVYASPRFVFQGPHLGLCPRGQFRMARRHCGSLILRRTKHSFTTPSRF
jgi:hypothetical protein